MIAFHNFVCNSCGAVAEVGVSSIDEPVFCTCGERMSVSFNWGNCNTIQVFKPYWEDNIDIQPIYIESKEQLAKECFKRDLKAVRLMDGYKDYHLKGELYEEQRIRHREESRRSHERDRRRSSVSR